MSTSPSPARFSTRTSLKGPRAVEVLDEAVGLLRQAPLSTLSYYYLGAFPFCVMLVYFCTDMIEGTQAEAHLPGEAALVTLLYLWMKTCQAVYARKLLAFLEGEDTEAWTSARWLQTALVQGIYAGTLLLVYPLALVVTLPFGWVNAFYHSISIVGTGARSTVRSSFREAANLSRLWPAQNHLLMGIVLLAWFVVVVNLGVFFYMLPELLNMFFGIESVLSENASAWNNSSFYLDLLVLCFLVLNPLNKAVYVLRCFYGRARLSGADLSSALRRQRALPGQSGGRVLAALLVILVSFSSLSARADGTASPAGAPPAQVAAPSVDPSVVRLNEAIQKTLEKDEFAWRVPRPPATDADQGWLSQTVHSINHFLRGIMRQPLHLLRDFLRWLVDADRKQDISDSKTSAPMEIPWRLLFFLIGGAALLLMAFWITRNLRRRAPAMLVPLISAPRTIDLEAEDVQADELPEDSWLALAQQMIERGDLRLALRAFYLATLSVLARQQLVRLGPAKSNRDYLTELARRLHGELPVLELFRENVHLFEASWYGTHAVTSGIVETVRLNHHQLRDHATA